MFLNVFNIIFTFFLLFYNVFHIFSETFLHLWFEFSNFSQNSSTTYDYLLLF